MHGLSGRILRTITHPGVPLNSRSIAIPVEMAAAVRLELSEGTDLFAAVHDALDRQASVGAAFVLVSGQLSRLKIMTGGPGDAGRPMGFRGPHVLANPLDVVAGAGGSGINEAGERFSHCHAVFRDAAGWLVGGHLMLGEAIIASGGLIIDLIPYARGHFVRRRDPETLFSIFHPEAA